MGNDATTSGENRFHELMLAEVRNTVGKLGEKVDDYRNESAVLHSKLDLHIATCDMRYAAAQDKIVKEHTPIGTPHLRTAEHESALFSKNRLFKRMLDGVVEHAGLVVIITLVQMAVFAWSHGFRP